MTIIKDTFFGGAEKKAAKATERGLERSIEEMRKGTDKARADISKLYPSAEENARKGSQGALDVMGQFLPQQANVFQQGNMNAQNQIAGGLPQIQNALMGGAIDYSQFQPQQINYDQGIFNQQLPDFQSSQQALNPGSVQGAAVNPLPSGNPFGVNNTANNFLSGSVSSGGSVRDMFGRQNMRMR